MLYYPCVTTIKEGKKIAGQKRGNQVPCQELWVPASAAHPPPGGNFMGLALPAPTSICVNFSLKSLPGLQFNLGYACIL